MTLATKGLMLTTVLAEYFYKLYHIVVDISTLF